LSQLALGSGYCLDANVIIDLCRRRYPKHRFKRLWEQFEVLLSAGLVIAPEEVFAELERKEGNSALAWAKTNKGIFVTPDLAQLTVVSELQAAIPKLAEDAARRVRPGFGDPFVVALAEARGWTVVTDEGPGGEDSAKIPRLCARRGVRCVNLLGLFDEQNWDL
jgi:predicted nucleic acid-binding protein